ncbi:MAG: hypothetical protein HXY21_13075 [Parvularculaceae bacterium]|nr:hypothetical protein [Parvularculaceae bacterium]
MIEKPKNPARPKRQPKTASAKKRRRARDPEIRKLASRIGERASMNFRDAAAGASRRERVINAIDKGAGSRSALKRRFAAFGRKILGPYADAAQQDELRTLRKRRRRRWAVLAQTARRAGLRRLKASMIDDPDRWRDDAQ